jgi:hypothetical protein
VTSDGGLVLVRELHERLGLSELMDRHLSDSRRGENIQLPLADLLRQSIYSRLAGYKDGWSLTSLQQRLVKTGGRLIQHARYYWLLLAESQLTPRLFANMLQKIAALPLPAG